MASVSRMRLDYTRAMIHAAMEGKLDDVETRPDPVFGIGVPVAVPGVPQDLLNPRQTWDDPAAYDAQAHKLAQMFHAHFDGFCRSGVGGSAPRRAVDGIRTLASRFSCGFFGGGFAAKTGFSVVNPPPPFCMYDNLSLVKGILLTCSIARQGIR